jgi:hypothetical protein
VQVTNLKFSEEELSALNQQQFFIIKNSATKKIMHLFGEMEAELKKYDQHISKSVEGLNISSGKIFRGENYKLFPYVVLDYPRLFSTRSIFAYRTMFWWGHEFSFTMHLQGEALDAFRQVISKNLNLLNGKGIYYCVNSTPWQYYFEPDNYVPIEEYKDAEIEIGERNFIKLSRKLSIASCADAMDTCLESYQLFLKLLTSR